jgi:transcription elongation factor Elf1
MEGKKKFNCPWCEKETEATVSKEKSDHADIVVRRCTACGNIVASYLDEGRGVLERVRTF